MFYKFKFIRYSFLIIYIIFLIIFLLSPNEVFAMTPTIVTDYYGQEVCMGTYTDFHPDTAPVIETIQSKVSQYGTPINDD
jgi:hypothetical protein